MLNRIRYAACHPRNCTRNCAATLTKRRTWQKCTCININKTPRIPTKCINYTHLISYLTALPGSSDTLGLSPRSNINKYNTFAHGIARRAPSAVETGRVRHGWSRGSLSSARLVKSTSIYIKRCTAESKFSVRLEFPTKRDSLFLPQIASLVRYTEYPITVVRDIPLTQDFVKNWGLDINVYQICLLTSESYLITVLIMCS